MADIIKSDDFFVHRYGEDDQLGAINEITPAHVLRACGLVKQGRVYPLGRVLEEGIPAYGTRSYKQVLLVDGIMPDHPFASNQVASLEEFATCTYQMGTHLDALGHIGKGDRAYGGRWYSDIIQQSGLKELGIEHVGPIITRGILLDIAGLKGVPHLEAGQIITPEDLDEACKREDVEVKPGDVLILHTGWGKFWTDDKAKYSDGEPGIALPGAKWITERRVAVVGADTTGVEAIPFADPNLMYEAHQHLLTRYGCYIIENLDTSELAADRTYEFCFILTPHTAKGATAAHVAPAALV